MYNKGISKNNLGIETFYGHEISSYGRKNNRVDYHTLAKIVDSMILNNEIYGYEVDYWQEFCGEIGYETEDGDYEYFEFYQYFMIDYEGARFLSENTSETVIYNERLNVYLWCIGHYGTSWSYVLTDIKINTEEGVNNE